MRRSPVRRTSNGPCFLALFIAFGLVVAADGWALPGVGGLAKKAKEKAAKAAGLEEEEGAIGDETVVFDEVVVELTPERLDRIVATYESAKAASAGRPTLVEKLEKVQEERNKHWEKHGEAIQEIRRKRGDVEVCRHDAIEEMTQQKLNEYSQKALTDPAIREKFTAIAQKYNAAAASGDSAATKAAQEAMVAVVMPSREDSLNAYKKCDPVPPPLPSEPKLDEFERQVASLSEQIRAIDKKVSEAQAKQGGMDREQFATAAERIQMYLSWRQSKSYKPSATRGFTSEEIEALEKYLEKLLAAMG